MTDRSTPDCRSKATTINYVLESVKIESKLRNGRHVVIAWVYRTSGSDDLITFCDNNDSLFNQVTFKNTLFICGDFIICLRIFFNRIHCFM